MSLNSVKAMKSTQTEASMPDSVLIQRFNTSHGLCNTCNQNNVWFKFNSIQHAYKLSAIYISHQISIYIEFPTAKHLN